MNVEALVQDLQLLPHPEGGSYRETFRAKALPFEFPERGVRSASTAIYFLLAGSDFSAFHRVRSDEVWHHYAGDALELHSLDAKNGHARVMLGSRIAEGERPQHVILAGQYQAARLTTSGYALCGCTVAPGFDFADFEMPPRATLTQMFPEQRALIEALTRR